MPSMNELLDEISRHHHPQPPATPEDIAAFEKRAGWTLDPDLRAFYLHCNGAVLFPNRAYGPPYHFLPLEQVVPAQLVYGADREDVTPERFFEFCDVLDGDYVMLDTGRQENGHYPLIDAPWGCFYDPKYCKQIASSLSEFLDQALRSEEGLFWLPDGPEDE